MLAITQLAVSADPLPVDLARPTIWLQATTAREVSGNELPLPRYELHLLADVDGTYPTDLNSWEVHVLDVELRRPGTVGWYRNPARASQESLGIVYEDGDNAGIVRPDFVFFSQMADGQIVADIIDPHGSHLGDALPKLKGLAAYAERNSGLIRRVEAVAVVDGKYRALDLADPTVRDAIGTATSAKDVYLSSAAVDF